MRLSILVFLALSVVLGVVSSAPVEAHGLRAGVVSSSVSYVQDQPAGKLSVDINVNKGGGGKWYANPLWVAVGGLGLLVLVLLIVMAARGGGTTVVK